MMTRLLPFILLTPAPLPGVDLSGLSPQQAQGLLALLETGPCPCDPELTLSACARQEICPPATSLIQEAAELSRGGLSGDALADAVVDRYVDRFVIFDFTTEGRPQEGPKGAPIQVMIFIDFQCPHCALIGPILEDLRIRYGARIRLIVKQYPLRFHLQGRSAALAALAAHKQKKYWEISAQFFINQSDLSEDKILEIASSIKLNMAQFKKDWRSIKTEALLKKDMQEGLDAIVSGTPMFYINGKPYRGERSPQSISECINALGL